MVLQINEQLKDGRRYTHNLHDLKLPSGDYCHQLDRHDLYRQLAALNVPDIGPHHGWQDLATRFSRWLQDGAA